MAKTLEITEDVCATVLSIVDCGLSYGLGNPTPGEMCIEAAVCFAIGEDHSDEPSCVHPVVRKLKIGLNDAGGWKSNESKAAGLRRLGIAQLGTSEDFDSELFLSKVVDLCIRKYVPLACRAAASIKENAAHKDALEAAALRCEQEGTKAAAYAAYAAANAANAANAAYAAYAAYAANAANAANAEQVLCDFAEDVVKILEHMKTPGSMFLYLTEDQ